MMTGILYGGLTFIGSYVIYFILSKAMGQTKRFFVVGLIGWALSLGAIAFFAEVPVGPKIILLTTHTTLWVLALNFLAGLANSVTLSILSRLVSQSEQDFSVEQVRQTYHQSDAVVGRMLPLITTGLVTKQQEVYAITSRGRLLEIPFRLVKWAFGIRNVG